MNGEGGHREVAVLAWPLAVGMLSFTVMGLTDTILMGQVSTPAQAGVGLATVLVFAVTAFFRGITSGAQSLVAAADGAGDALRIRQASGAAILVGVSTGIIALILVLSIGAWGLAHLSDDKALIDAAGDYIWVRALGLPISLVAFGLMSSLQGIGDTRIRMWASIAGNAVNIALDCILIFGLGPIDALGATGAAIATVCGQIVMAILYAWRFFRVLGRPKMPSREVMSSTLTVGLPAGMQAALGSLAFSAMTVILARIGSAHLAANQIVINIISVSFLPGYGLGEAGGVLVGRYLGAGRPHLAGRAIRSARSLALVVMGGCALIFMGGGFWLASFFSRDFEVVVLAEGLLMCAALFQLFDAAVMVHLCALRNAGDTRFTLVVTSVCSWGIMLPLAFLFASVLNLGAPGAWMAMTIELAVLAALTSWRVTRVGQGTVGRLDLLLGQR